MFISKNFREVNNK
ncbi:hypothetical protein VTH06DRAFT_5709 [Thermothelomyces fergusii]